MKSVVIALLALAAFSAASAKDEPSEMVVALVPMRAEFHIGEPPTFIVAVRATTSSIQIFDFGEREDLRRHNVAITIKKDGNTVDTPSAISDPVPSEETDLRNLEPGMKLAFEYDGYPANLRYLSAGTYLASVTVWRDPEAKPVQSNVVTFRVKP